MHHFQASGTAGATSLSDSHNEQNSPPSNFFTFIPLAWRLLLAGAVLMGMVLSAPAQAQNLVLSPTSLTVDEGSIKTFTVQLDAQPENTRTITLTSTNPDVTVNADPNTAGNQTTLTFTASNWNVARTVRVLAAHDADRVDDTAIIMLTGTGITAGTVTVDVIDDDDVAVGLILSRTSLTMNEGSTAAFLVKLDAPPGNIRTISLTSVNSDVTVDTSSYVAGNQTTLTFTAWNWATSWVVLVRAAHDADKTDDIATINLTGHGIVNGSVDVTVTDDEDVDVGLTVSATSSTVNEGGALNLGFYLSTKPVNDRIITLTSNNSDIAPSPEKLTFTPDNWGIVQPVTVTVAEDDDHDDEAVTITIKGSRIANTPVRKTIWVNDNDAEDTIILDKTWLGLDAGANVGNSETRGTFTVRLSSEPSANRTVTVSPNKSNVTVDKAELTFARDNWAVPQTVRVGASRNAEKDNYSAAVQLTDPQDSGLNGRVLAVLVQDPKHIGATLSPAALSVNEGSSGSFTVRVNSAPKANRTVRLDVSDGENARVTLDKNVLTFTPFNWNTPQKVTVNATQDANAKNGTATIRPQFRVVNADGVYGWVNADSPSLTVSVIDDEIGLELSKAELTMDEGNTALFKVKLDKQPASTQTITLRSDNDEVTFSPATLTFTTANWNEDQTVTLRAAQDADTTDDEAIISLKGAGIVNGSVDVTVTDDDVGVTLSTSSLTVNEGSSGTFTVELASAPAGSRTVNLVSSDTDVVTVSSAVLEFTSTNWSTPRTVTVTGVDDDDTSNASAAINLTGDGIVSGSVSVTVTDDDVALTLSSNSLTVDEGSSGTFTVELAAQPAGDRNLALTSSNSDVTLSSATLTFTTANWSSVQTVTVSAANDADTTDDTAVINLTGASVISGAVDVTVSDNDDAAVGLELSRTSLTVDEGASGSFTVRLASKPVNNRTVTLRSTNPDVTLNPAELKFTGGDSGDWDAPQTVRISAGHDGDGNDDTAAINLTGGRITGGSVSVMVNDDDVGLILSLSSLEAAFGIQEGGRSTPLTARLASQPAGDRTVTLGSPSSLVTFSPASLQFTAGNWDEPKEFRIIAGQDDDTENNETRATLGGTGVIPSSFPLIIYDDDLAEIGLTLSATSLTVNEGGTETFTVRLATGPEGPRSVFLESTKPDVTVSPASLNFTSTNWNTVQTVTVTGVDDNDTADGSAAINLTGGSIASASVSVTVNDDDAALVLSPTSLTVNEGASGEFTVQLAEQPDGNRRVNLASTKTGVVTVSPASLDFTSTDWNTAQTVTVTGVDDDDTANGSAAINLSGDGITPGSVTVTVADDDVALRLSSNSLTVDEGGSGTFTVELAGQPDGNRRVSLASTETGVVTISPASLDFTSTNWSTPQDVTVTGVDDDDTANGSAAINLSGDGIAPGSVSVSVTDDDVRLILSPSFLTVNEGGRNTFTVELASPPNGSRAVNLASANTDVTISPAQLTFTGGSNGSWSTPQTVTVEAAQDADKTDETAALRLTGTGIIAGSVEVSIIDDDIRLTLSATSLTIDEGGSKTFTAQLDTQPGKDRTVTLASKNADITPSPATLTFTGSNWNQPQTVTVSAAHDDDGDNASTTISLAGAGITDSSVTVSVIDDDIGLTLSRQSLVMAEGGSKTLTVELAEQPENNRAVNLQSEDDIVTLSPDALTFTADNWDTPQTVTVAAKRDDDNERELVTVSLTGAGVISDSVKVVITDDYVGLTLSASSLTLDEGDTGTFTARLTGQPAKDRTINLTSTDPDVMVDADPDMDGNQTALTFTRANWNIPRTVTITAGHDDDLDDESATINLTGAGIIDGSVSVSVTDDDVGLILSGTSLRVQEGSGNTFQVRLTDQPSADVTVTLTLSKGHNLRMDTRADQQGDQNTLTFTPSNWSANQTVQVTALRDRDSTDKSESITLTAAGGGYDAATGLIAVEVLDVGQIHIVSKGETTLVEGEASSGITFRLLSRPSADVIVTLGWLTDSLLGTRHPNPAMTIDVDPVTPGNQTAATFTPSNWGTGRTAVVTAIEDDDSIYEAGDFFIRLPNGEQMITLFEAVDNDVEVELSTTSLTLDEGGSASFTVNMSGPSENLNWRQFVLTSDNPAITFSPGRVSFLASEWNTPRTVTVRSAHDDDAVDETGTITLTDSYGHVSPSVTVEVTDDDDVGLTLTGRPVAMSEGTSRTFTVQLDRLPESDRTVRLESDNPDLTFSVETLTFTTANWDTPQDVTITAGRDEGNDREVATMTLTGADLVPVSARLAIADDHVGLTLSDSSLTVPEGKAKTFTVRLFADPGKEGRTVALASANAHVTIDTDPDTTGNQTALTFTSSDWRAPQTVTIAAAEDDDSDDETVSINLSGTGIIDGAVEVTVTDDDIGLELSATELTMDEGGTQTFTVRLGKQPGSSQTVTLRHNNTDIKVSPTELTFAAASWNTDQTVTLSAAQDNDRADDKATINLTGTGVIDGAVEVTVTDDDVGLELSAAELTMDEGGTQTFTVKLDEQPENDQTITLGSSSADVTFSPATLTFTGGDDGNWGAAQTVTITAAHDDDTTDDKERIALEGTGVIDGSVGVVVIDDDIGLELSAAELTMDEGRTSTFTVRLDKQSADNQTITLGSTNTDVTFSPATLTFTGGDDGNWGAVQTVTLTAADDADTTDDRATINLSGAGIIDGAVDVTVTDDDIGLELSATKLTMDEGGIATFTVKLDEQPENDQTLTLGSSSSDVTVSPAAALTFTASNWNTAQTVTLNAARDADKTDDKETISLTGAGIITGTVDVTVLDDDIGLTLSSSSLVMEEGGAGTFTVQLDTRPEKDRTVSLTSAKTDVTFSPSTLTFTAAQWNVAQTVTLTATQDTDKMDASATINLAGSIITGSTVTASVIDDDVEMALLPQSFTMPEGGSKPFNVELKGDWPGNDRVINLTSDTSGVTPNPSMLTFSSDNWSDAQTVTATAEKDDDSRLALATISLEGTGVKSNSFRAAVTDSYVGLHLSASSLRLDEGGIKTFTVRLTAKPSSLPTRDRTINLTSTDPDVTIDTDPDTTGNQTRLTFTASDWDTPQTVTIAAAQDDDSDNETVSINLSGAGIIAGSVPVSVTDNDAAAAGLSISWTVPEAGKSGSGLFAVHLGAKAANGRPAILMPGGDEGMSGALQFSGGGMSVSSGDSDVHSIQLGRPGDQP
ncbi:MAG: hypothetical protein ISN29_10555, partial [Gammaproteobacteria bacterium AqS3]|nr:hypothetical protein [Gammaproteobacteria bacterium AqS3]